MLQLNVANDLRYEDHSIQSRNNIIIPVQALGRNPPFPRTGYARIKVDFIDDDQWPRMTPQRQRPDGHAGHIKPPAHDTTVSTTQCSRRTRKVVKPPQLRGGRAGEEDLSRSSCKCLQHEDPFNHSCFCAKQKKRVGCKS